MKTTRKTLQQLLLAAAFGTLPVYAEPSPSPKASPTLHAEPSPTAPPRSEPSPSATPRSEPSPSATPEGDGSHKGGGNEGADHGDRSLRGFYKGTTATGATAVFYVESNVHVQIHVLDVAGQTIGFAEGALTDHTFSLTLTTGEAITGTVTDDGIAVILAAQPFQATRLTTFGANAQIGGRYFGVAHSSLGESRVMIIIDANSNILLIQRSGNILTGGYGTVTAPVDPATQYTFTLDHVIGSSSNISGSFTLQDGAFDGTFTTSTGTFTVLSFKQSVNNHMANISTRGLVGPGQAQLIGGFIITGGPKMVLIRAKGPSLAAAGVSNVLANPSLQLYSGTTLLGSNDDWKTNANADQIVATKLPPTDDLEASLLIRLEPGAYTTVVSGADSTPGIALVEVFEIGFE